MEYADQTLAQLLLHRALTDDEAREMLLPTLDALAFLHGRNLVQGQLKPANILVVGDQLKLASDTIRRVTEGTMSANTPTVYDPPEARHGSSSTADDIWALGVSLFEALTRRPPSGLGEPREAVVLPADFSPAFRDVVARCLSPSPQDRPSVTELVAWARGRSAGSAPAATIQPAALVPPEPRTPEPASPQTAPPQVAAGSGAARAVHGTVREAASLAYRDARSGRDSRAGLDRSARVQNPSHARSSSTSCSGSRRITATDPGRRRTRGSGGAGACLCGLHHKARSERRVHFAIGAP